MEFVIIWALGTTIGCIFLLLVVGYMKVQLDTARKIRNELTTQWIRERESLIEEVEARVDGFLREELVELKDDIARYFDEKNELPQSAWNGKVVEYLFRNH